MTRSAAFLVAGLAMAACSSSHASPGADAGDAGHDARFTLETGAPGDDGSGGGDDAGSDAPFETGPVSQTLVRLADWSPDAIPLDFCVAPHGTASWEGPLLAIAAALDPDAGPISDAGHHGLTFPSVTAYLSLAPGPYDVRLVSAQATDCSVKIVNDAVSLPAFAVDAHTTILVVGDASNAGTDAVLTIASVTDDSAPPPGGGLALRFINAAPDLPSAAFGTGSLASSTFAPLFTGVAFGKASSAAADDAGAVDSNGYLALPSLDGNVSVVATGGTKDVATVTGLSIAAGFAVTVAVIGGKTGAAAPGIIECFDDRPGIGLLSPCAVVGP